MTPGVVRLGAGGRTGRSRPVGKAALGGYGLGGLVWVWLGLVWAQYFAPSLPSAAAAAAPGEAPGPVRGHPSRRRRAGGRGRGRGAACGGRGLSPLCARGALWGRGGRARGLGGGGGLLGRRRSPGRRLGVGGGCPGLPCRRPDRHRCLRQPPLLALREGLPRASRGDGGAGAGPVVVAVVPLGGGLGVRHHCYPRSHAWWQACPLHYLLVHLCSAVGSAMQCFAGGGGGWR